MKYADNLIYITIQDLILGEGVGYYHQKGSKVCDFGDYELVDVGFLSRNMRRDLHYFQNGAICGEGYFLILDEGFGNRNGKWTICMLTLHVILEIRMFIIYYAMLGFCLSTKCSTL